MQLPIVGLNIFKLVLKTNSRIKKREVCWKLKIAEFRLGTHLFHALCLVTFNKSWEHHLQSCLVRQLNCYWGRQYCHILSQLLNWRLWRQNWWQPNKPSTPQAKDNTQCYKYHCLKLKHCLEWLIWLIYKDWGMLNSFYEAQTLRVALFYFPFSFLFSFFLQYCDFAFW